MFDVPKATALLATFVVAASSCASSDGAGADEASDVERARLAAASVAAEANGFDVVGPGIDIVAFDDDHQRFIVLTDPSAVEGSDPGSDGAPGGEVVLLPSSVIEVVTATGAMPIDDRSASLPVVAPESAAESNALAAHGSAIVALLLSDSDGVIIDGVPQRFVYTEYGLFTLDALPVVAREPGIDSTPTETDADAPGLFSIPTIDGNVAAQIAALPSTIAVEQTAPGVLAVTTDSNGDDLATIAGVASVESELLFGSTADPLQGQQWAIENTGAPDQALGRAGTPGVDIAAVPAWDVARGAGVVVAVIDSGVQMNHPDLVGRYARNAGETCGNGLDDDGNGFIDDCSGWDFGSGDADPSPDAGDPSGGHGTHVAGTVAAGENGVGVVGVAPDAEIMALKVSSSNGSIRGSALIGAINYASANGADVINMSLSTAPGIPRASVAAIENAVDAAVANGVSVVVAAGNHGIDISSNDVWPASLSKFNAGVITAGASTNTDVRAGFSNHGTPISLWAPGESILSTAVGSSYEWRSGTSMATPTLAGAVAVLLSSGTFSPDQVRTHLQMTSASSSAGPRLDLASAVGASTDAAVSVQYRGAGELRPDVASTLSIDASATNAVDATQLQISVATLDEGSVVAVGNLSADLALPDGTSSASITRPDGSFAPIAIDDIESGITIDATLTLPQGDYAFITELLTATGERVGGAQVAYLTASEPPAAPEPQPQPETTVPDPVNPPPTTPPTTDAPAPNPPSTNAPTPNPPATNPPALPNPSPATTVATPGSPATIPATTAPLAPPAGDTSPPAPSPTTSPTTSPPATNPPATRPPAVDDGTTSAAPTTSPAPTTPNTTQPPTTTPVGPGVDGDYRLDSMWPVAGPMDLSTVVTLTGVFPTRVPVYVWWEGYGAVEAHRNDGQQIEVRTPWVETPGIADVEVRFTVGKVFELASPATFTFLLRDTDPVPPPATTPSAGGPGSSNSTPPTSAPTVTTPPPGPTPPPTPQTPTPQTPSTQPPTTQPPTTQPPATQPPATQPPATQPPASPSPETPTSPVVRQRGALTLSPPQQSTAMVRLSPLAWQPACVEIACAATEL
ncbi:MAG: S8 family serine peptidase [Ilumatobacter sp.]